jgi:tyrosine-protein kinase Etk/Wzc
MIEPTDRNFNLWKLLVVLAHRRKFIISFVLICTVGAVVTAFLLPRWYRAKTSILPSQQEQQLGLSGTFAQFTMSSAGFELPIMATPSDVYATMLKSETVARAVIDVLKLQEYLKEPSSQKCILTLKDRAKIGVTGEGVIELYFQDRNPQMAARIANEYITQLDRLNRRVRVEKATSDKEFIQNRLDTTKVLLDSARVRLRDFQTSVGAVDLEKQRDLAIDAAVELKTKLALAEAEYAAKRRLYSENHPDVGRLSVEVSELKRQVEVLEQGNGRSSYLNLPLAQIPGLTIRYSELLAEVTIQEKVYSLLTALHEEARIKEQKDTPTIAVLETAYPPEIKYRPMRTLIVVASFFASLILAVFVSLFADYLENLRRISPSDFELLDQARQKLTGRTGYGEG